MAGAIQEFFKSDHERLDALAHRAGADPARFDREAFDAFRDGLLRHMGMEEKILFPTIRRAAARPGAEIPASYLRRFRVEHAALASLLVGTPTADLLLEIQSILTTHNRAEEEPGGLYERCDCMLGSDAEALIARMRAFRSPRLRPYQDHPRVLRRAEDALRLAMGSHKVRSDEEPR
jgi:hypothetical protein